MLSYNDALHHSEPLLSCNNCGCPLNPLDAQWYESPSLTSASMPNGTVVYNTDAPAVPICPTCDAEPWAWLPSSASATTASAEAYLASRPCEKVPY